MQRTGKKARLAAATALAATDSPEPSPQKAKKGKQRSAPTPVEVDDYRDDSPARTPRTSSIVQIIFSFWSFEISEGILRNQKIIISLESFSNQRLNIWPHLDFTSLCIDYPFERCKLLS